MCGRWVRDYKIPSRAETKSRRCDVGKGKVKKMMKKAILWDWWFYWRKVGLVLGFFVVFKFAFERTWLANSSHNDRRFSECPCFG